MVSEDAARVCSGAMSRSLMVGKGNDNSVLTPTAPNQGSRLADHCTAKSRKFDACLIHIKKPLYREGSLAGHRRRRSGLGVPTRRRALRLDGGAARVLSRRHRAVPLLLEQHLPHVHACNASITISSITFPAELSCCFVQPVP